MKQFSFLLCIISMLSMADLVAAKEFKAEDFDNQSQIIVQDDKGAKKCQAVRIAPKWYLTAAHCVRPFCDKECAIIVDMLQGELYASAIIRHSSAHERVFVPPTYHPGSGKSIRSDIALLFFDSPEHDYFFKLTESNKELSRAEFIKLLRQSDYADQREQWQSLENSRAKLFTITNSINRKVLSQLAVPDVVDGTQLVGTGFYYFTELHHFIGPDFGVEKGLSGSGIVVPGGAIVGIVSSALSNTVTLYNEKDEPAEQLTGRYFLFTPISQENAAFISSKMKSVAAPGPMPYMISIDPRIAEKTSDKLKDVFGEFETAEDILSVKENK